MRVLLVSSSSGSLGGGELYLIWLGAGLARRGLQVITAMSDHPRMDGLAKACAPFGQVSRLAYRNTYDRLLRGGGALLALPTIGRLKRFFQAEQPDIIHINKQNVEDGLDLLLAARKTGIPTVATIHVARGMADLRERRRGAGLAGRAGVAKQRSGLHHGGASLLDATAGRVQGAAGEPSARGLERREPGTDSGPGEYSSVMGLRAGRCGAGVRSQAGTAEEPAVRPRVAGAIAGTREAGVGRRWPAARGL